MAIVLCAITFVVGIPSSVLANEISVKHENLSEIDERYTYIRSAQSTLKINGGTATIISIADATPAVTKCFITSRLQKKVGGKWTTIDSWTVWGQNEFNALRKTKAVPKGYEYRVFSTMKAYVGSKYESRASFSSVVRY